MNKNILDWLNQEGYPLEMQTASFAEDAGFDVSQSDYYIDPEDSNAREIDVVCNSINHNGNYSKSYNLFIECKSSKKAKPWIVFSNENNFLESPVTLEERVLNMQQYSSFIVNDHADRILLKAHATNELNNIYPRLGAEPMIGHGVTQAFTSGTDVPFKAMMSATKAAMSHIERFGEPLINIPCVIAIPVVVIDSPLYSVSYNSNIKEFIINKVSLAEILWKHLVAGKSRNAIFIVEKTALKDFFTDCKNAADWWMNISDEELHLVTNELDARDNQKP